MLNGIHLVDFGNHRNTRLTFGRMTALVGQNGAGKTTVMRAVQKLCSVRSGQKTDSFMVERWFRGDGATLHLTTSWPMAWASVGGNYGLHLAAAKGSGEATVSWLWANDLVEDGIGWIPAPAPEGELPNIRFEPPDPKKKVENKMFRQPNVFRLLEPPPIVDPAFDCRYFKTTAAMLHGPSYSEESRPRLGNDGSNLAWTLAYLMTADPDRFATIVGALKEVIPAVNRIRAQPAPIFRVEKKAVTINEQKHAFDEKSKVMGQELLFDMRSGNSLPAIAVSEGTLVTLAILTLIHGSEPTALIMLDDVELGLHPKAQRDLIRQLRRIQETHPQLQIILSTHSPYVVDEMKPEEVWLFAPDAEGCAVARRLDEHPNAKRALEVLTTGEFWSAEGEGWVLRSEVSGAGAESPAHVAEEPPQA